MKPLILKILVLLFLYQIPNGNTQGLWKWVSGSATSGMNVYGTTGVPSISNHPSARYTPLHWIDNEGHFWLYGGGSSGSDLWSYNPNTNEWTFFGSNSTTVYNTKGVPSPTTWPGISGYGGAQWTDNNGDLWMYGTSVFSVGTTDDLWKYNIASGQWTWMHGNADAVSGPVYGVQGIPSPTNTPGAHGSENTCSWVDNLNNLFVFDDRYGIMWKFDIALNQWVWMTGTSGSFSVNSGPLGTFSPSNHPGIGSANIEYGLWNTWTDNDNCFWLIIEVSPIGGSGIPFLEMWKYNPSLNQWALIKNFDSLNDSPSVCSGGEDAMISYLNEERTAWVDDCNNMWKQSRTGTSFDGIGMWRYNVNTDNFVLVNSFNITTDEEVEGVQDEFSILNHPKKQSGQAYWQDSSGFWLINTEDDWDNPSSVLWLYQPDTVISSFTYIIDCGTVDFVDASTTGCNNIKSWQWDFGDGSTSVDQNPEHNFTSDGSYDVSLIVHNCTWDADTITQTIDINCGFNINIEDTSVCSDNCVELIVESNENTDDVIFTWSGGVTSTNDSVLVCPTTTTTYNIMGVNIANDTAYTSVTVLVSDFPIVDLGNDTTICDNSYLLDAENSGDTYLWQDGSINQTYTVLNSGTYYVDVTTPQGCLSTDTVNVNLISNSFSLGNDTTLCNEETLILSASPIGTYLWQDGSTNQTYTVTNSGVYFVEINTGICLISDTIDIQYEIVLINLGNDTTICDNSYLLDAENSGDTYLWQDGSTNQTYYTTSSGGYYVEVTSTDGCLSSDTINVNFLNSNFSLGNDTLLCNTQTLLLTANPVGSYVWQDGSINQSYTVTQSGVYNVIIDNGICIVNDTIIINYETLLAGFSITDTIGCFPLTTYFTDESVSTNTINNWGWDFGDNSNSILENPNHDYTESNSYEVVHSIVSVNGCVDTIIKQINIDITNQPTASFNFSPESPMVGDEIVFENTSTNATDYLWSFNNENNTSIINPSYIFNSVGNHSVLLLAYNGTCIDSLAISINLTEELIFYVPNAFTPDNNRLNNVFLPIFTSGFDPNNYHLLIYNRWGEKVFETNDVYQGWSGLLNDKTVDGGVYIWKINFKSSNNDERLDYSGHVVLLK